MIAAQFKKDYAQMTAQGVEFTPEDIVRLNALAVKVRLSQDAAQTVHLPRLAFLGRLTLREPTIAHELWIEEAARWIDTNDDRNFLWLHGYALSQKAEKLPDAFNPKKLVKAVYRFAGKRLCGFTHEQLTSAVEYVLFGANWIVGERGPEKSKSGVEVEERTEKPALRLGLQTSTPSPTIGLLVNARAMRLPITLDDAKRMTASELEEAIVRARIHDEDYDRDRMRNEAFGEYVRAREEIRARSKPTEEKPENPKDEKTTPCK